MKRSNSNSALCIYIGKEQDRNIVKQNMCQYQNKTTHNIEESRRRKTHTHTHIRIIFVCAEKHLHEVKIESLLI